jgi:hypothetical protein
MGRREIFHTFSLLVEIEGHFTHEFVTFTSMRLGTGSLYPADFATIRRPTSPTLAYLATSVGISRCDGRDIPMVVQPLRELQTLAIFFPARTAKRLWSIFRGSGISRNGCAAVGISRPSQRDLPIDLEDESYRIKISRIWRTSFDIDGCSTIRAVAFRRAIFNRKNMIRDH